MTATAPFSECAERADRAPSTTRTQWEATWAYWEAPAGGPEGAGCVTMVSRLRMPVHGNACGEWDT